MNRFNGAAIGKRACPKHRKASCDPWYVSVLSWAWIIAIYIITVGAYYLHGTSLLDSDMSSEMVLAKDLLSSGGGILDANWFYSTELRVINIQLVFELGLAIFSSNWHLARTFSIAVLLAIYVASYVYFAKSYGFWSWGRWFAGLLLIPFSVEYMMFILYGSYYIPHIAAMFLSLGLYLKGCEREGRARRVPVVAGMVVAFVTGLGGSRQALLLYIPLLICAVYECRTHFSEAFGGGRGTASILRTSPNFWRLRHALMVLCANLVGVLINVFVLSRLYTFQDFSTKMLNGFSLSRYVDYLATSVLEVMGYRGDIPMRSMVGIGSLSALAFTALMAVTVFFAWHFRDRLLSHERMTVLFAFVGMIINALAVELCQFSYYPRYLAPFVIVLVAMIPLLLERVVPSKVLCALALGLSCLCAVVQGTSVYYKDAITMRNESTVKEQTASWLVEKGYLRGCATFWNSNVLVELSDGELETWTLEESYDWADGIDLYEWLQVKSHIDHSPEGKVFLALSSKERDVLGKTAGAWTDAPAKNFGDTSIYLFDSYEELQRAIQGQEV